MEYQNIYPPAWSDRTDPQCPDCGDKMFYVGKRGELLKGDFAESKVFQCRGCRRLFKEVAHHH